MTSQSQLPHMFNGRNWGLRASATPSFSSAIHALSHSPIAVPSFLRLLPASSTRTGTPDLCRARAEASPAIPAPAMIAGCDWTAFVRVRERDCGCLGPVKIKDIALMRRALPRPSHQSHIMKQEKRRSGVHQLWSP